ncbi:MAG TPA: YidC/Oxa1 family membrane protein insertase [Ktedonobacteraceae bacterium]
MALISNFFNFVITYPIFNVLMLLYHLFGDFALSIIVLTIAITAALLPLTWRQLKSMKARLALQPEVAEIRRRYAQDLRAQYEAKQELYKRNGISTAASYLPLLIQIPIFIGLYSALNIVLNHATLAHLNSIIYPFLPQLSSVPDIGLNWFTMLNAAWHISLGVPDPTHILPILAGIVTFVQMRMSQPNVIADVKDATMQLTQLMQFILPLIMVLITIFIGWQLAAGLALYRITSLLLNMVQQFFVTGKGSLFAVPHVGGITDNGGLKNDAERQERQSRPRSSSSTSTRSKGASARRRRRGSKKNKPRH